MTSFARSLLLVAFVAFGLVGTVRAEVPGGMTPAKFASMINSREDLGPNPSIRHAVVISMARSYANAAGLNPSSVTRERLAGALKEATIIFGMDLKKMPDRYFTSPFRDTDRIWSVTIDGNQYPFWNASLGCPVVEDDGELIKTATKP